MRIEYKKLLSNFSYLSFFQLISIGVPFLTYPFIISIYGGEVYGKISWAKASIQFLMIVVNFGFDLSATREIANHINDKKKIGEIVSTVYLLKFFLTLSALLLLFLLTIFWETASDEQLLLYLTFGWVIGELLIPLWYFQGLEKMKMITFINGGIRITAALSILLFVNETLHYSTVPFIEFIFILLGGFYALYYVFKNEYNYLLIPTKKMLITMFNNSIGLFFSRGMFVLIEKLNIIIIQFFIGFNEVAVFDIASKIARLLRLPFLVINQAIYPYLNQSKNMKLVKILIVYSLIISVLASFIIGLSSDFVLNFVLGNFDFGATEILYVFLFSVPFAVLSFFLGSSTLLVNGFTKEFNNSVIYSGFAYLLIIVTLYLSSSINLLSIAFVLIFVELIMVGYRFYFVVKNRLLH